MTAILRFPKSYPATNWPYLSINKHHGLTSDQVSKLLVEIRAEAKKCVGGESVFAVCTIKQFNNRSRDDSHLNLKIIDVAQAWMRRVLEVKSEKKMSREPSGISLALEMQNRAIEAEKV